MDWADRIVREAMADAEQTLPVPKDLRETLVGLLANRLRGRWRQRYGQLQLPLPEPLADPPQTQTQKGIDHDQKQSQQDHTCA